LQRTSLVHETVRVEAHGAGILPVARRPDGHICVLLAREQVGNWKGSQKWSGFEGGRKDVVESIEQTAVREWREESLDCLQDVQVRPETLRSHGYACRHTLQVTGGSAPRYHITYVVRVPYQAKCVEEFAQRRKLLMESYEACQAFRRATVTHLGIHRSIADIEITDERFRVQFTNGATVTYERPYVLAARVWLSAYETFRAHIAAVDELSLPGLLSSRYGDNHADIVDAELNADFFEKDCVRWWSIRELERVLQNGGRLVDDRFRTYFLPVLQGCMQAFHQLERERF
jgi:hypothetical protein